MDEGGAGIYTIGDQMKSNHKTTRVMIIFLFQGWNSPEMSLQLESKFVLAWYIPNLTSKGALYMNRKITFLSYTTSNDFAY